MHRPGSMAASTQAAIGNVAAGTVFATFTSAGAGGYGAAALAGGAQLVGGAVAVTGGLTAAIAQFRPSHGG